MDESRRPALTPRRVRIRTTGDRTLSGEIHVAAGQSLVDAIRARRHFLNLTDVVWSDGEVASTPPLDHVAIRVQQIVWLAPITDQLPLTTSTTVPTEVRDVELELVDGRTVRVRVHVAAEQRVSDYFESNPGFIPLYEIRLGSPAEPMDGIVLNGDAILAIRETSPRPDPDMERPDNALAPWPGDVVRT